MQAPGHVQRGSEGSGEGLGGLGVQSQVRFNRVPERVPEKVPGGFGAEPGQVQQVPEKVRVRFNRVPKKVPGGFGAEPGQVQQGSGEGSGEGLGVNRVPKKVPAGGFGAEPSKVQQGSGEGSGEGLGVSEKVPEKVWEALVQSQVRFNRVPENVPVKVWEALVQSQVKFWRRFRRRFREALVQSQVRFNRVPEKVPEKVPGSLGGQVQRVPEKVAEKVRRRFWESLAQGQVRFNRVSSAWLRSTLQKICKNEICGCWGYHRSLFPQQRKLMGSSTQNSSSVHWCRRRVKFNEVPEKVPKDPEKVWEALVQSQVTPTGFRRRCGEGSGEGLGRSQVRFNRVPEKVPDKVLGGFGAELVQLQQGSGEGSGEGLGGSENVPEKVPGGFGAEPGQVQQVPEKVRARFNRVPKKVPGGFGAETGQVQQGSGEGSGEGLGVSEKLPVKVWEV